MRTLRAAALALCFCAPAAAAGPRLVPQRLVLRTAAGDVVLGLYEGAPKTAAQVLRLARLGVYDGARFSSVVPGFYAEIGETGQRAAPLSPRQQAAIRPLPAELSSLKHRRGVLSMAHRPGEPGSARTAFSIMLGSWPQGDGRYTVFGEVLEGLDVVDTLAQAPADASHRPLVELQVYKAQVMTAAEAARTYLAPAHLLVVPGGSPAPQPPPAASGPAAAAAAFLTLAALAAYACRARYPRAVGPLLLCGALGGVFSLLVFLGPRAAAHPPLAVGLFLALLGALRLLSSFETPA